MRRLELALAIFFNTNRNSDSNVFRTFVSCNRELAIKASSLERTNFELYKIMLIYNRTVK